MRIRTRPTCWSVSVLVLFALLGGGAAAGQEAAEPTLYERLGGYEPIAAVVNDFAAKLFVDPNIGAFFKGMSTDSRQGFVQKNINLVCNVTGGPCKVISRPARTAHAGLGITNADFDVVFNHLVDTLDKFGVPAREKEEVLAIANSLRADIVES